MTSYNPETIEQLEADISKALVDSHQKPPHDLLELIKTFLLPRMPVDDSKSQLEEAIETIAKIPFSEAGKFFNRIIITHVWNDVKKPPILIAGDMYRSADGSNYPRTFDQLGKAGSRYALTGRITRPFKEPFPDPKTIFDKVMVRDKFRPHPSGISATLFYLAIIITHDLFNSDHTDPNFNKNSSYLDLSPLYGSNVEMQKTVRTFKQGLLKPDSFADARITLQPPGVGTMLILFSRSHNTVARKLLEINERGRFTLKGHSASDIKKQDEDLFQTARLITCGFYLKIVLHNYLRTILGIDQTKSPYIIDPTVPYGKSWLLPSLPTGVGSRVSLEFNYIYRWHPTISQEDEKWIEEDFFKNTLKIDCPEEMSVETFRQKVGEWKRNLSNDPAKWTIGGLKKDKNGKYKDTDLARVLVNGTKWISGNFGPKSIPKVFRVIELIGIEGARFSGLCSLNDFRQFMNLKRYESFKDMNPDFPDVASELEKLYGDVNNVELYPGLMTERTKPTQIGSAFGLPFTISRSLLADAINVVRNDRFFTDEFGPHNLTTWGFNELQSDPRDLATGGILHKVILRELPGIYKENSAWALYPFTTPEQTKKNLSNRGDGLVDKVDFEEPKIP